MIARKFRADLKSAVTLAAALAVLLSASNGGRADHRPYIEPDGVVVYGDWGLYRPGHVVPWIEGPLVLGAPPLGMGGYFPSNRNDPKAYRRRPREPGPNLPPAPYYRSWGAQSQNIDPNNASVYAPFAPPDVIYAPKFRPDHHGRR